MAEAISAGERPGVAAIAARQDATARATAAGPAAPVGVVAAGGVPPVPVLVEGVPGAELAAGVELVWLLELDLPPPQPASTAPQASAAMSWTITRRNISFRSLVRAHGGDPAAAWPTGEQRIPVRRRVPSG